MMMAANRHHCILWQTVLIMSNKDQLEHGQAVFIQQLQAVNSSITENVARDAYNVLDAIQVLLALPKGERIVINKSKEVHHN